MNGLTEFVERFTRPRSFSLLCLIAMVPFAAIFVTLNQLMAVSGGYGILDFEVGYSSERVREVLGGYGTDGMALYRRIQLLDLVNPALYSLISAALTMLVWRDHAKRWLALFPFLAGFGDYLENITLFLITYSYPQTPDYLISASSSLSYLKYGLMVIGFSPLVAGLVLWCMRVFRKA